MFMHGKAATYERPQAVLNARSFGHSTGASGDTSEWPSNCRGYGNTVMFVDVDGVLNVGVKDPGFHSISLNEMNIIRAKMIKKKTDAVQKILSVCTRQADGEKATYEELCKDSDDLVEAFVERLAQLIMIAKVRTTATIVMSSSWRTKNLKGVRKLEKALSQYMGEPFTFDAQTDSEEPGTSSGRLNNIGNFLTKWSASRKMSLGDLQVLVLEDFHINPLHAVLRQGERMTSTQDVETFLRNCVPDRINAGVCLLHTYDAWTTEDGIPVHIGSGLTMRHFCDAIAFLKKAWPAVIDSVEIPWDRAISDPSQPKNRSFECYLDLDLSKQTFARAVSCP